jgi:hypothetical protein
MPLIPVPPSLLPLLPNDTLTLLSIPISTFQDLGIDRSSHPGIGELLRCRPFTNCIINLHRF